MCSRESRVMAKLDAGRGRLRITDINSTEFLNGDHSIDPDTAMQSIHGRFPDGRIVEGPAVFRAAYDAVGWGWLWAPTGWPIIRPIVDVLYKLFARWRYRRRTKHGYTHGACPSNRST